MQKIKVSSLLIWTAIIALIAVHITLFGIILLRSPENLKVQYIPDDAYYYLTLSRNFHFFKLWTFDSGASVTSGFHPLFAYALTFIFMALTPNKEGFIGYGLILSLLFALASVGVVYFWGFKSKNSIFLMLIALVFSSKNFVYNAVSVTEWSLVILIASLYCVWFSLKYKSSLSFFDVFVIFILGFLGSVARSDFGLLPLSIFIAVSVFSPKKLKHLFLAFGGLLGSITGLFAIAVHNFIFTGDLLQSSAKMKAYWAQTGNV